MLEYLCKRYKKRMTKDEVIRECHITEDEYKKIFHPKYPMLQTVSVRNVARYLESVQ